MHRILIQNGTLINEGSRFVGYIEIQGETILRIGRGAFPDERFDGTRIEAAGKLILPGVIDDQVHFREPGLTEKADIQGESRAAVAGGVTSFMEMPNTTPPTTSAERLEAKFARSAEVSPANYSFYLGATNDNIDEIRRIDPRRVCGVKLFMGSSTGNMLVDREKALAAIFAESPILIATHCEDEATIRSNFEAFSKRYGGDMTARMHPLIRSAEACYRSSAKAVELATRYNANLHVLHLSTARELTLFENRPLAEKRITNEVCVHHLWFSESDYALKGNFIKWNPAIKNESDREALRNALAEGRADMVATDHAPHTLKEKLQPYLNAPSGGPSVQFSLPLMLEMSRAGIFTPELVVEKMCHAPAIRFAVQGRGFLREGYKADLVIVDPDSPWRVTRTEVRSKCGWSPFEGTELHHRVTHTLVNGRLVYQNGQLDENARGEALVFDR